MAGVGNLRPNTVLLEWKSDAPIICNEEATKYLDRVNKFTINLLLLFLSLIEFFNYKYSHILLLL